MRNDVLASGIDRLSRKGHCRCGCVATTVFSVQSALGEDCSLADLRRFVDVVAVVVCGEGSVKRVVEGQVEVGLDLPIAWLAFDTLLWCM